MKVDSRILAIVLIVFAAAAIPSLAPTEARADVASVVSTDAGCSIDVTATSRSGGVTQITGYTTHQTRAGSPLGNSYNVVCHISPDDLSSPPSSLGATASGFVCVWDGNATTDSSLTVNRHGNGTVHCRFTDYPPI